MTLESNNVSSSHSSRGTRSSVELAKKVAIILREDAALVDREGKFPTRGVQALKRAGLMGLLVPKNYGGTGSSYTEFARIAQILSAECLSTALIWAMHCQQVAVLVEHASEPLRTAVLHGVAQEGSVIASITSETGKGGHLLTALAPLVDVEGDLLLSRKAPTVTSGLHADAYLITMRASEMSSPSDVVLVYTERDDLNVTKLQDWNALGMRGTESVSLSLNGRLSKDQVVNKPTAFRRIAVSSMIPVGHIGWAACWLGAAWGVFRRVVAALRDPATRGAFDLKSDLFAARLARIRLEIDAVDSYLFRVTRDYEQAMQDTDKSFDLVNSPSFQLRINGLKLLASERLFHATNELVELMGIRWGYLNNDDIPLERTFRDLRSASLMFSNDRLLIANGKLSLLESSDGSPSGWG